LNVPLYFCTEDRVAAAYSIALGANTIFFQRNSNLHTIYKNRISIHIDAFCSEEMYRPDKTEEYKRVITSAFNVWELRRSMLFDEMERLVPSNSHEIMQYISYLYCYSYMYTRIGSQLERHRLLVTEFIENAYNIEQDVDKRNTIFSLYHTASTAIPVILSHNIHSGVAFPSLPTVNPISYTGIVGPSEIYIAGLLYEFKIYHDAPRYVQTIIDSILRLSVASEELTLHYEGVLRSENTSGGFIQSRTLTTTNINYKALVYKYIAFLKSGTRYNQVTQDSMGIYGCGDVCVCSNNVKHIVAITGCCKEELRDYEEFCMQKLQEERDGNYDSDDAYYDSRIVQMILAKKAM
jgi:hypothetical protein